MEIVQVMKDDDIVVFDLVTAECLNTELMAKRIESGLDHAPSMTPRPVALDYFSSRGFRYTGDFIMPMAPGPTKNFVFRK